MRGSSREALNTRFGLIQHSDDSCSVGLVCRCAQLLNDQLEMLARPGRVGEKGQCGLAQAISFPSGCWTPPILLPWRHSMSVSGKLAAGQQYRAEGGTDTDTH
jgi:hypothetical protein